MQALLAGVLVAVIRRHVAEKFSFITEAFGDDVDATHKELAHLATGDVDDEKKYWNSLWVETFVKGQAYRAL